jgi:spore maturation protein CgeB
MSERWDIVVAGLSITSSWGNGHATTYRGLLRELARLGHRILFLERDVPWYAENRDIINLPFCQIGLYQNLEELRDRFLDEIRHCDAVILGSYVPDGAAIAELLLQEARGIVAFYDIDTPVTLAALRAGKCEYLAPETIPLFDLYLSFTGGPTLSHLELVFGAQRARPLYCSTDQTLYYPEAVEPTCDLGYLGTYSPDRQKTVDELLVSVARRSPALRFMVAGPGYPNPDDWPANIDYVEHLAPQRHRDFYNSQRLTLNVTRAHMIQAGYSPSVRLFEAAACGAPVISDSWQGLDSFFEPGLEILVANSADECCFILDTVSAAQRQEIGRRARQRVLREHTAAHRARELTKFLGEAMTERRGSLRRAV